MESKLLKSFFQHPSEVSESDDRSISEGDNSIAASISTIEYSSVESIGLQNSFKSHNQKQIEKKKRAAKYDLKKILRDTESTVIRECADTSTAIDTIDGFTLFKKKDVRLDPNYLTMSDKEKTERDLKISRNYEKYLLMFTSHIKKNRNIRERRKKKLAKPKIISSHYS